MHKKALILSISFILLLSISSSVFAEMIYKELPIPKESYLQPVQMIFSENGAKFALLVQEKTPTKKRGQALLVYDVESQTWEKAVSLAAGYPGELRPLAFSFDGAYLAVVVKEDILVIDTVTMKMTHNIADAGSMTEAVFSYDNRFLAFLMGAEWEMSTKLCYLDLTSQDAEEALQVAVGYKNDYKVAGPLYWAKDGSGIYYIEEFTWGTINGHGILKKYMPSKGKVQEVYRYKSSDTRVTQYYYSFNEAYRSTVIRGMDDNMEEKHYGLFIQKDGAFVYGTKLDNWQDPIDVQELRLQSTAGWVENDYFYWINRTQDGSNLYVYDMEKDQRTEQKYENQVFVTPTGVILELVQ